MDFPSKASSSHGCWSFKIMFARNTSGFISVSGDDSVVNDVVLISNSGESFANDFGAL